MRQFRQVILILCLLSVLTAAWGTAGHARPPRGNPRSARQRNDNRN